MEIALAVFVFGFLMVGILWFGRRYLLPGALLNDRLATVSKPRFLSEVQAQDSDSNTRIQNLVNLLPAFLRDASGVKSSLVAAGYSSEQAIAVYHLVRIAGCAVFALVALGISAGAENPIFRIILPVSGALAAFFGADFVLEKLITKRHERLRFGMPDALDLLIVCVESGLGLDQAILKVSKELMNAHPDISQELGLVNLEMRAGMSRAEALRNLASRTGSPELRKLIAVLLQSDRFGTSMAESLRTHSDYLRVRRRQEAEERAAKVGVKLVFPIFFFLLPSMLIVSAGPGILQVFKYLFPMMRNIK
jgi:tight adherence protein C